MRALRLAENLIYPVFIFILLNTNLCPLQKIHFSEAGEIRLFPVILCTWIFLVNLLKKPAFILNYKSNLSGGGTLINQSERASRWSDRKHPRLEIKQMIPGDPSPRSSGPQSICGPSHKRGYSSCPWRDTNAHQSQKLKTSFRESRGRTDDILPKCPARERQLLPQPGGISPLGRSAPVQTCWWEPSTKLNTELPGARTARGLRGA